MGSVVVLGFDALSPWMVELMPILRSMEWRVLDSVVPLTPPSWASIMSGVNPGKHGVLSFYRIFPGWLEVEALYVIRP